VQAGVWWAINSSISGRVALAVPLIEAGLVETAVAALKRSSPAEWMTWKTRSGILAGSTIVLGWTLSTLELPKNMNKTLLLLDRGYIDVSISAFKVRTRDRKGQKGKGKGKGKEEKGKVKRKRGREAERERERVNQKRGRDAERQRATERHCAAAAAAAASDSRAYA
jgi:hypothetical protein